MSTDKNNIGFYDILIFKRVGYMSVLNRNEQINNIYYYVHDSLRDWSAVKKKNQYIQTRKVVSVLALQFYSIIWLIPQQMHLCTYVIYINQYMHVCTAIS